MRFDVVIVGAGAAGLHCAADRRPARPARCLLVDHAEKVAEKIRISGGGRCNFTNLDVGPQHFDSANPDYCRSALARYTPRDFIALRRAASASPGTRSTAASCSATTRARRSSTMLLAECATGRRRALAAVPGRRRRVAPAAASSSTPPAARSRRGAWSSPPADCRSRRSAPATGATRSRASSATASSSRARRWCRSTSTAPHWQPFAALAGVALPVRIDHAARPTFAEDLLFTHRGLSGPAALQASTYWRPGEPSQIDLAPGPRPRRPLRDAKSTRRRLAALLVDALPRRLAEAWLTASGATDRPVADLRDRELAALAAGLQRWSRGPVGQRGLPQGRGHGRRRRHPGARFAQRRKPARRGPPLHRRSGRRDRLARRLQLPVGLGQRRRLCPGLAADCGAGAAGYNRCLSEIQPDSA